MTMIDPKHSVLPNVPQLQPAPAVYALIDDAAPQEAAVEGMNTQKPRKGSNGEVVTPMGVRGSAPSGVGVYGAGGTYAGQFDGALQVNGDARVTGTLTVQTDIVLASPAADFAEEFDLGVDVEGEPGSVMVLDASGALAPCCEAYDRKVAGVISGAGAYKPGLVLDRQLSSDKRMPIALVGKVYCKVDASLGAIAVGDLLTTSSTPGHAMRAHDPHRAFGAVIGKALAPLAAGQGLIPVLVAVQ
jgi:hypothetical protein